MNAKLPGTKRVRFNAVIDHASDQRLRRQARLRSLSLSATFRAAVEALEREYKQQRATIIAAHCSGETHHENGDGV